VNLSLLPVLDSAKEPLISIWRELIDRVGMTIAAMERARSHGPSNTASSAWHLPATHHLAGSEHPRVPRALPPPSPGRRSR
jgi:hypothetical protein